MYNPNGKYDLFGFTEAEELWDRVSLNRFKTLLFREDVQVVAQKDDKIPYTNYNTYGYFAFPTIRVGELDMTLWGLGWHENREKYIDYLFLGQPEAKDRYHKDYVAVDKQKFWDALMRYDKAEQSQWAGYGQSENGEIFALIADLADEDGAYAELEDWGLL